MLEGKNQYQIKNVYFIFWFLKCFSFIIYCIKTFLHHLNKVWQNHGRLLLKIGMLFYSSDCQKHLSKLISPNYSLPKFATPQWTKFYSLTSHSSFCCKNGVHSGPRMGSICRYCGSHHIPCSGTVRGHLSVLSAFLYSSSTFCVPTTYSNAGQ